MSFHPPIRFTATQHRSHPTTAILAQTPSYHTRQTATCEFTHNFTTGCFTPPLFYRERTFHPASASLIRRARQDMTGKRPSIIRRTTRQIVPATSQRVCFHLYRYIVAIVRPKVQRAASQRAYHLLPHPRTIGTRQERRDRSDPPGSRTLQSRMLSACYDAKAFKAFIECQDSTHADLRRHSWRLTVEHTQQGRNVTRVMKNRRQPPLSPLCAATAE